MKGVRPDWFPNWEGQYVAVIGGGNSVKRNEVESLQGRLRVVVINESWQLAPWADALYACDTKWWALRYASLKFSGLKISQDGVACATYKDIKRIRLRETVPGQPIKYWLMDEWGVVGSGQGSGFQCVNWLAQLAVKGIMLIGFDGCTVNGKIHWHGRHPDQLNNPDNSVFMGWKTWFDNAAPKLQALGIEVVNCSMVSTLGCFPRHTVNDALERWKL